MILSRSKEQWKDITGYEGLYQASNCGRIRTHPNKITSNARYGQRHWKCRIMKGRGDGPTTGKRVGLWKDGEHKDWLVARLIALTWVDGYKEGMTVNHINGNRMDNHVSNLEWLSLADNIRHGFRTGLYAKNQRPVALEFDEKIITFPSLSAASRFLGKGESYLSCRIGRNELTCCDGTCKILPF